ncbi:serine protein kinase RIO [Umezawaea endophytica]|uniref:non-specific serine/threonine protein kinase n=1 Tax=Umezawaea endophytica TaxID=1654476 RepID=A0A9X3A4B9_9PSEU|nr:RIO1 family regulatory kinase/ATPase [Umezawaea endophytica]MCS7482684.1 kinase [Umezawaea endophytica]
MREHEYDFADFESAYDDVDTRMRRGKKAKRTDDRDRTGRLTKEERAALARVREDALSEADKPEGADRWSTWDDADHGPTPRPDWVITDLGAADRELGIIKTGKEADVFLVERRSATQSCLMAAKRYRGSDHRMFHRDAGYLEGRRMRRSREMRAMSNRSSFGRNLIAEQWAVAEFAALGRLWSLGAPVPYPVQRSGTELLLEFLGDEDGTAAPRLAQTRPDPDELVDLWTQLVDTLTMLAAEGVAHGDLSAFNLMVHEGRLVLIDLPQVVDLVANPLAESILERDVRNVSTWFTARGLAPELTDPHELMVTLVDAAGLN